jgi:hypothetical protein
MATFPEYADFLDRLVGWSGSSAFRQKKGEAYHLLLPTGRAETKSSFEAIRKLLRTGSNTTSNRVGKILQAIPPHFSDEDIWKVLVRSLPPEGKTDEDSQKDSWKYGFNETVILSHTLLLWPRDGTTTLCPKNTPEPEITEPHLVVRLVGDSEIKTTRSSESLSEPERLRSGYSQKLRAFFSELLWERCITLRERSFHIDALLLGSRASQATVDDLSQAVSGAEFHSDDEINLWSSPPPKAGQKLFEEILDGGVRCLLNPSEKDLAKKGKKANSYIRVLILLDFGTSSSRQKSRAAPSCDARAETDEEEANNEDASLLLAPETPPSKKLRKIIDV